MSKKGQARGLGRGLGALIPEVESSEHGGDGVTEIELAAIRPNPDQPRKEFDQVRLEELAASIKEHGIVQPIVVRPRGEGFEIVAGERRFRAAGLAGLERVPALVREFSEAETMEIALIENLQREDLNPLEEAEAYRAVMETFQLTQEALAQRLGRSRSQIANTLRLLQLSPGVREEVRSGRLSMGHAKVLLGVESPERQLALAQRVVADGLSVRQLEELSRPAPEVQRPSKGSRTDLDPNMVAVESRLREHFGTPVKLQVSGDRGRIEITFYGEEGLNRILDSLRLEEQEAPSAPKERFRV